MNVSLVTAAATAILVAGMVDDFRTRKFHNWLFLVCLAVALGVALWSGTLTFGLLGLSASVAIFLPLVLMKIVGAGDLKLMMAFGLAAGWDAVLSVAIYGLIWGALFGVLASVFRGHGRTLVYNMVSIVSVRGERKTLELQKIPFTIAIFMGWLSFLTLRGSL